MKHTIALALACLGAASCHAVAAESYYYRNVNPSVGNAAPAQGTPVKTDPVPEEPAPSDQVGPLKITQSPAGDINLSYKTTTRTVFHSTSACETRAFRISGVTAATLAGFGITAGQQGNDYVISGQLNRVSGGGYNITVTAVGCGETASASAPIYFNADAQPADAPWALHIDGTNAFSGKAFAFYPEIQNLGAHYETVDTTGFTYALKTLDPTNRPIPAWLSMPDPKTGVLVGQAPAAGSYGPYYLSVTSPGGYSDAADFVISVSPSFVFNGPNAVTLEAGKDVGNLEFTGSGGCGSVNRYFTMDSNSNLPTGLTLVPGADSWIVQGTPTAGGTWPVRFAYTDYSCAGSQFFPVTFTVTGAPEPAFAFTNTPYDVAATVGGDPLEQYTAAYLDTTGPSWTTTACEVVNADGSPANLSWAKVYPSYNYQCIFTFQPTDPAQVGTYPLRLKATTDTNRSALSNPFTLTVSAAAPASPTP